jgi:hypothetical protein
LTGGGWLVEDGSGNGTGGAPYFFEYFYGYFEFVCYIRTLSNGLASHEQIKIDASH